MSSNLKIIQDWVDGNNLRPVSINFVEDSDEKKAEKNAGVGEQWTDVNGKVWEKTSYGKKSVPKVITALKETNPRCKACGKEIDYGHRYNVTTYGQNKMCFDCTIELDTQRKLNGTFKDYEKLFVFKKQRDYVNEVLEQLREGVNYLTEEGDKMEFVNEFGDIEKWSGLNVNKLREEMETEIKEGEEALIRINEQLERLKANG